MGSRLVDEDGAVADTDPKSAYAWARERGYEQYTQVATSEDGIHFKGEKSMTQTSYLRVFRFEDTDYGLARLGCSRDHPNHSVSSSLGPTRLARPTTVTAFVTLRCCDVARVCTCSSARLATHPSAFLCRPSIPRRGMGELEGIAASRRAAARTRGPVRQSAHRAVASGRNRGPGASAPRPGL